MLKDSLVQPEGRESIASDDTTQPLLRDAQQMLQTVTEAKVQDFILQFQDCRLNNGPAAALRNGHRQQRKLLTAIGSVTVKVP